MRAAELTVNNNYDVSSEIIKSNTRINSSIVSNPGQTITTYIQVRRLRQQHKGPFYFNYKKTNSRDNYKNV